MVFPIISRRNTSFRQAVPAGDKLVVTLRCVIAGDLVGSSCSVYLGTSIFRLIPAGVYGPLLILFNFKVFTLELPSQITKHYFTSAEVSPDYCAV